METIAPENAIADRHFFSSARERMRFLITKYAIMKHIISSIFFALEEDLVKIPPNSVSIAKRKTGRSISESLITLFPQRNFTRQENITRHISPARAIVGRKGRSRHKPITPASGETVTACMAMSAAIASSTYSAGTKIETVPQTMPKMNETLIPAVAGHDAA